MKKHFLNKYLNLGNKIIPIFVIIFSSTLIILESYSQAERMRLTTDFVSWGLSAMAPIFNIGLPYINYWGINPPGVLMFTAIWGFLFGSSLFSFHILFILSISVIVFLTWIIINKVFRKFESLIIFVVFVLIFFSRTVQSQFFPSEINGLLLTLTGLFFILKNKVSKKDVFFASLCFILASQMKGVFAFTGLSMLPHFLKSINIGKNEIIKFLTYSFLGIFTSLILIFSYLEINQAYGEYNNILKYKSEQFSITEFSKSSGDFFKSINYPKDRFIYLNYQLPLLLTVSLLSFFSYLSLNSKSKEKNKNQLLVKLVLPKNFILYTIILAFWVGSTIGYMLQGRYGNKYEIQSLIPMLLITTLSVKVIFKVFLEFFNIKLSDFYYKFISILLLILFLAPKPVFFIEVYEDISNYNFKTHIHRLINFENPESIELETYINSKTNNSDCITAVYGWGIGNHYYYSKRSSCSKYFLINILPKDKYSDYQKELINNPPKAIIYNTVNTDFNISQFENNGFNFSKVISSCYKQDIKFTNLFWNKFKNKELSECILIGIPKK